MIANLQRALNPTQLQEAWKEANANSDTTLKVALFVKGCGVIFGIFSGYKLTCNVMSLGCHAYVKTRTLIAIMMSVLCLALSYDIIVTAHTVQQSRTVAKAGDNFVEGVQKGLKQFTRKNVDLQTGWTKLQWSTFTADTIIAKHLVDLAVKLHKAFAAQLKSQ